MTPKYAQEVCLSSLPVTETHWKTTVIKPESVGTIVEIPHHDFMMLEDSPSAVDGSNNMLVLNEHPNCLVLYCHKPDPFR